MTPIALTPNSNEGASPSPLNTSNGDSAPASEQHNGHTNGTFYSSLEEDKTMPIAVVGMSFRGPSDATSVENLWKMICERREGWSEIPKERWNNDAFYHPDNTRHGTVSAHHPGFSFL